LGIGDWGLGVGGWGGGPPARSPDRHDPNPKKKLKIKKNLKNIN